MMRRVRGGLMMVATALACLPAYANAEHAPDAIGRHHGMYGWGGMFIGPIVMIVVIAAVVVLVVLLLRWLGVGAQPAARKTAIDILEERFARGEIDREEFEERRRVLED